MCQIYILTFCVIISVNSPVPPTWNALSYYCYTLHIFKRVPQMHIFICWPHWLFASDNYLGGGGDIFPRSSVFGNGTSTKGSCFRQINAAAQRPNVRLVHSGRRIQSDDCTRRHADFMSCSWRLIFPSCLIYIYTHSFVAAAWNRQLFHSNVFAGIRFTSFHNFNNF